MYHSKLPCVKHALDKAINRSEKKCLMLAPLVHQLLLSVKKYPGDPSPELLGIRSKPNFVVRPTPTSHSFSPSLCVCVYMNGLACICAGSIHKRPSVQSDKVPISQSCDSDFLSVCQTAAEGLSIQARAHILSHLLKHKLTRPVKKREIPFLLCAVCQAPTIWGGMKTLDYHHFYFYTQKLFTSENMMSQSRRVN